MNLMLNPSISFLNAPANIFKFRSDTLTCIKGDDSRCISLQVKDLGICHCKLLIRLLLKEPDNVHHFYHLYTLVDKHNALEIEHELKEKESVVKLDFFGIKKSLKKDAMAYLKEHFRENVETIYKQNSSSVVLAISLIDRCTNEAYDILKFEFTDRNDSITIEATSPHTLVRNEDLELTFVLKSPEKDNDSIFLELEISNQTSTSTVRPTDFSKPISLKNVFRFPLKKIEIKSEKFRARLCRKGPTTIYSDWKDFKIIDSGLEHVKRKSANDDGSPASKIARSISTPISEFSLSEISLYDGSSSKHSNKSQLKCILEAKQLSSIARIGHDYAFGRQITDKMKRISEKLPIVFILQDDVGDSPLHNAILQSHEDRAIDILSIVQTCFPNDLFTRNTSNHTALILSPACGVSADFVQRLIFCGFQITDKDIDGNNALTIAIQYKNTEVLNTLVQNAIIKDSFKNDCDEVKSLVKRTVLEQYFRGYEILMTSKLTENVIFDDSDFNSESAAVFNNFYDLLNLNAAVNNYPQTAEEFEEEMPDTFMGYVGNSSLLIESQYQAPLPELSIEDCDLDG